MGCRKTWISVLGVACVVAPLAAQADPRCRTQSLRGEWLASVTSPTADDGPLVCQFGFTNRQGALSGHCQEVRMGPGPSEIQIHRLSGDLHVSRSCELSGIMALTAEATPYNLQINGQVWSGNTPKLTAGTGHAHVSGGAGLELFMGFSMHRIAWSDPAFPSLPGPATE